ncbi:killer cell lectin-like receptor subfamily B member 1C [Lissotriton helveticus]
MCSENQEKTWTNLLAYLLEVHHRSVDFAASSTTSSNSFQRSFAKGAYDLVELLMATALCFAPPEFFDFHFGDKVLRSSPQIPPSTTAIPANRKLEICLNSGFIFERTSLTMKELKYHLCEDLNESTCVICPYNWLSFRGRCYLICEELNSWTDSEEYCISRQSRLILIDDENAMIFAQYKEKSKAYFWIGLRVNESNSEWTWLNGSTLREDSILMKYNGKSESNCGSYSDKQIFPLNCNSKNKWICEKKAIQFDKKCFGSNR